MLVKYMGVADIKRLCEGDDLGGQFSEPLPGGLPGDADNGVTCIQWDASNRWIVDTEADEYSEIDSEFWDMLVELFPNDFRNVSDYKRIPVNLHQTTFLGMKPADQKTEAELAIEEFDRKQAIKEELAADVEASNAEVEEQEKVAKKVSKKAAAVHTSPSDTASSSSTSGSSAKA